MRGGARSIAAMPAVLAPLALLAFLAFPRTASADEAPTAAAPTTDPPAKADPPTPVKGPRRKAYIEDASLFERQRLPWYSPTTLSYEEGMPIPPGYALTTRRRRSLIIAGTALLGGSYLASALTAGTVVAGFDKHRSEVAPLFIPLAGPFVTLATSRDVQLNDVDRRANGVLLLVDGAAQLTGAALIIVGLVTREPILQRTRASYETEEARARPEVLVGGRSASLLWRF